MCQLRLSLRVSKALVAQLFDVTALRVESSYDHLQ